VLRVVFAATRADAAGHFAALDVDDAALHGDDHAVSSAISTKFREKCRKMRLDRTL